MSEEKAIETEEGGWSIEIKPQTSLFAVDFAEIWRYRDLCAMLVKRDIVTVYKQMVLVALLFICLIDMVGMAIASKLA